MACGSNLKRPVTESIRSQEFCDLNGNACSREVKYSEYLLAHFKALPDKCRICITQESCTLRYRPTTRNAQKASTSKPSDGTLASTPEWNTTWSEPQRLTRRPGCPHSQEPSTAD